MFKVYTNDQLSNDAYHEEKDHVSGSTLAKIFNSSLASWRFGEETPSEVFEFGTAAHTNILEGERFTRTYMRGTDFSEIKDLITSQTGLSSKLKELGIVGTSGKKWDDLIRMYAECGENFNIRYLMEWIDESVAANSGKELIAADKYDDCLKMRSVLLDTPEYAHIIENGVKELSIFGVIAGVNVKVRLDCVTDFGDYVAIDDYKTTANANPEDFGRSAHDHGYFLKMALQRDLFVKAFEEERPVVVRLLAQEKKQPYLAHRFRLTDKALEIGRRDYMSVLQRFAVAKKDDVWPGYLNGVPDSDLPIMPWVAKKYGIEME